MSTQMTPPRTCADHLVLAGFIRDILLPAALRRGQRTSREGRSSSAVVVAHRRRPNAVFRMLSTAPLYEVFPYGQKGGMERGVLGEVATYQFGRLGSIIGAGSYFL